MKLKKLLPIEQYKFTTNLSAQEVIKRIADSMQSVRPAPVLFQKTTFQKPYTGQLIGNHFTMSRNITYKNSFAPVITGQVLNSNGKTEVEIKLQPMIFVLIFMAIWLGGVGVVCLGFLITGILQLAGLVENGFTPIALIPFAMFAFGAGLVSFSFKSESQTSKSFLKKIIEGEEV